MNYTKNIIGKRFGNLTVLKRVDDYLSPKGCVGVIVLCRCDCGKEKLCRVCHLIDGKIKSCGCLKNKYVETHGLSNTRLYRIWMQMKNRCLNKNNQAYKYYGGRGITVCDEWKNDFKKFYDWAVANCYKDDLTIDRKNVNDGYCPKNCRWIEMKEQQRNKRNNVWIEYNGKRKLLVDWLKYFDISYSCYQLKKDDGSSVDEIFSELSKKQDNLLKNS